jgi:hypothetical protein
VGQLGGRRSQAKEAAGTWKAAVCGTRGAPATEGGKMMSDTAEPATSSPGTGWMSSLPAGPAVEKACAPGSPVGSVAMRLVAPPAARMLKR